MTDPSPTTEIVLTSDSFYDDPAIEFLSPAALAVLNSYMAGYGWLDGPTKKDCRGIAAALRAAAEIIAPVSYEDIYTDGRVLQYEKEDPIREKLLSIANELETR